MENKSVNLAARALSWLTLALLGAAALIIVDLGAGPAAAQTYPVRPIRMVVGFSPGGPADVMARLIGQRMAISLGQPSVVENRAGAGGTIAARFVAESEPDGYTLLLAASPNAINASLYDKLSFNFIRDIAPVAAISREPNVVVVNPSVSTKTIPEFIAHAKANSGRINMASSGNGTRNTSPASCSR